MNDFATRLTQESEDDRIRRFAYHEAGHATVALVLFRPYLKSVMLGRHAVPEFGEAEGSVDFIGISLRDFADLSELTLTFASMACGGIVGEDISCGYYDVSGGSYDIANLRHIVWQIAVEDYRRKTGVRSENAGDYVLSNGLSFLLDQGGTRAEAILRKNIELFRAIAERLLHQGRVEREELNQLADRYITPT